MREEIGHRQGLEDLGRDAAEFQVSTFGSGRLHQADQGAESAAVDELDLIELQHDIAVLGEAVTDLRVQSINFISGHDASVTLHDHNVADRAAFQAQLHSASLDTEDTNL